MRLGFVTTPNTLGFALHISTGSGDYQHLPGNPGRKARALVLAEILKRGVSSKKMPCQPGARLACRRRLFEGRSSATSGFGSSATPSLGCVRVRESQTLSSNEGPRACAANRLSFAMVLTLLNGRLVCHFQLLTNGI